jgi:hypothetical protein
MKWIFVTLLILSNTVCFADAGFSIRRKKAAVNISFSGTNNLTAHKLIHRTWFYTDTTDKRPWANKGNEVDDKYHYTVQNGGKRWEESDRYQTFIVVDMQTGATTDSFTIYAKEKNILFEISGVKDGKLVYETKKNRAVYQYTVIGEDDDNIKTHKINLAIYIVISLLGLSLLVYHFMRQKKHIAI